MKFCSSVYLCTCKVTDVENEYIYTTQAGLLLYVALWYFQHVSLYIYTCLSANALDLECTRKFPKCLGQFLLYYKPAI